MRHEEGATPSPSAVDKPSTSSSSSTTPPSSPSVRGTDDSEEGADEGVAKGQDGQQVDLESNGQEKVSRTQEAFACLFAYLFERHGTICLFCFVSLLVFFFFFWGVA